MKKLIQTIEVEGEGLTALMGENVLLFCLNYIYTGKLIGVNDKFVLLEGAQIVYQTGAFTDAQFKDAQCLPTSQWYVQTAAIESFGVSGK
jgi:hypothetical protein